MNEKIVNSVKTISKTGQIGWSITTYQLVDGKTVLDRSVPIVYCKGATSEAEAIAMIKGGGVSTFATPSENTNETTGEVTKFVNYAYGNLKVMDVSALTDTSGKTREDAFSRLQATLGSGLNEVEKAIRIKELKAIAAAKRTPEQKKELALLEL